MTDTVLRAHLLWSLLEVLTRKRLDTLLQVFPDLVEALAHLSEEMLKELGCRPETIAAALEKLKTIDMDAELRFLRDSGARLLCFCDPEYPFLLREIPDAPPFLYVRGDIGLLHRPCVAMVGTRRMSAYGKRITEEFARLFAGSGVAIISGLARGIDSVAAETTIDCKGITAAVLGQGIATLNGQAKDLADRIVASGGLVLSEFPLASTPDMFTFPRRNRIIAGLSLATVVLEAPEGSGALITAKLAFDYGREVFAAPGQLFDENFTGSHALVALQKALLADRPARVLEGIGVLPPCADTVPDFKPTSPEEQSVYKALTRMPQNVDDLVAQSGLPASSVSAILTTLQLCDAAEKVGADWVRR